MKPWLFNGLRYASLTLLVTSLLAGAMTLRHEHPFPAPCDQFTQAAHRERCARFLADRDTVGHQTFSNATTVSNYEELRDGLMQDEDGHGLILLVTSHIDIVELAQPMETKGVIAIVGDPGKHPKISNTGLEVLAIIVALADRTGTPGAFFCWGIEWLQDRPRTVVQVSPHFGAVHIMHSIFRINSNPDRLTAPDYTQHYLTITLNDRVEKIKNSLVIGHNHFYGAPAELFHERYERADIAIVCNSVTGSADTGCHEPGVVVIRDNTWHGNSTCPESVDYVAIRMVNIARAIVFGNQAADNSAVLSVYVTFDHRQPSGGNPFFNNLNLQLVNNTALPGMEPRHRRFYLYGLTWDKQEYPLAGIVNMTCNPNFNVQANGSFANLEKHDLSITTGNNYCAGGIGTYPDDNCGEIVAHDEDMGRDTGHDESGENNNVFVISTYALGSGVVSLAALSWELFWSLVYHHTSGNTQILVNGLALFIPGCFHRFQRPKPEKSLDL